MTVDWGMPQNPLTSGGSYNALHSATKCKPISYRDSRYMFTNPGFPVYAKRLRVAQIAEDANKSAKRSSDKHYRESNKKQYHECLLSGVWYTCVTRSDMTRQDVTRPDKTRQHHYGRLLLNGRAALLFTSWGIATLGSIAPARSKDHWSGTLPNLQTTLPAEPTTQFCFSLAHLPRDVEILALLSPVPNS